MTYRFEFRKRDSILLAAGGLSLALVLFFAGFLTDRLIAKWQPSAQTGTRAHSPGGQPKAATAVEKSEPVAKSQQSATPTVLHEPVVNPAASSASNVQLAVEVGVFAELAKAKHMVQQLQKEGFSPIIASQTNAENQQISVVEIGPFSAWEDASRVAQVIGRSLGSRPAVRPML